MAPDRVRPISWRNQVGSAVRSGPDRKTSSRRCSHTVDSGLMTVRIWTEASRMSDRGKEAQRELSTQLKRLAEQQPLKVELTEEQLEALRAVWDAGDPAAPAQITFMVQGRDVAEMAVAGYRYRGDTCCV